MVTENIGRWSFDEDLAKRIIEDAEHENRSQSNMVQELVCFAYARGYKPGWRGEKPTSDNTGKMTN